MAKDTIKDLQVAIVGAGIGGLALAMGLEKKGVPYTIYEAADEYSVVGAGIGFGPNGDLALDMIEEGFRAEFDKVCMGNMPGHPQDIYYEGMLLEEGLGLNEPWRGKSAWGHPDYVRRGAHRVAVLQIMTSFIPIENVRFSKCLKEIEQHPDRVVLKFADGEVAEASVLVGADGIKSMVREHVLGPLYPSQVAPVYADSYCYRGVIPTSEANEIFGEELTNVAKMYVGDKRCCVTYLISKGDEFNFLLCALDDKPWEFPNIVSQRISHEAMMADFEGPGVDERFRRLLKKAMPVKWGFFHHRYTSTYYRDRVVLLGDSAHASLPFQAAGAGQGLEDSLILSNVLGKIYSTPDKGAALGPYIRAGFSAYDAIRRPRAQMQLERAYEMGHMLQFQHPETGRQMETIAGKLQDAWFDWIWFHDLAGDVQTAFRKMDEALNA
ncbi:putative Salicylate hydroxylase [Aspergillus mulundensis]|uniref:Putative Salicylate hydroxylase n=1 Tax=Aspergillus mulundensis TaxID=1810919 RepID=A0A3D8QVZ4_9EURO|nr:putative Salicylate hydroxylase [Aspergillus mulundensis]RDW65945.1 putative Salicylate hydroxylase [Aspergillus mulundensis]